ncbi:MAG: prolipoprotein diacylglyceryl transferase [Clostridia bacterium]|nr:prolipoprotein diacylglyceryl transferase [Clostridia bacterium]
MNYIAFPGLNIALTINPVAFNIGDKEVYWYGIIIALGVFMGTLISLNAAKKEDIKTDTILDLLIFGVPSALICGRLYYCIFKLPYYIEHPEEIIAVWKGGIAIYGGIIGAIISTGIYCKIKKLNWKQIFDIGILGVITGQIIGRWGNFINAEAYGTETTMPWRMEIINSGAVSAVHPTFLYESLWNLIGLFILLKINKHKKRNGDTFFSYLIWYGIGRALIEGLRTDSLYLGPLRISQVLGIVTALLGIIYFLIITKKEAL